MKMGRVEISFKVVKAGAKGGQFERRS